MTKCMKRRPNAGNAELPRHDLKITQDIPLGEFQAFTRAENKGVVVLRQVPIQQLAKLNAHWYEALFVALAYDPKKKAVQAHLLAREAKQLLKAQAGIERGEDEGLEPSFRTPDGLPVYEPKDLLRAEG